MPQKARPDKIANFNPEAKVASPPIDYSKTRAITDKPWLVACVAITVARDGQCSTGGSPKCKWFPAGATNTLAKLDKLS